MDWSAEIEITILTSAGVIIAAIHYLLVVFELGVVRDDIGTRSRTPVRHQREPWRPRKRGRQRGVTPCHAPARVGAARRGLGGGPTTLATA